MQLIKLIFIWLYLFGIVNATPGSINNSIYFNSNEVVNYSIIEDFGIEGINYLKFQKPQFNTGDTSIGLKKKLMILLFITIFIDQDLQKAF